MMVGVKARWVAALVAVWLAGGTVHADTTPGVVLQATTVKDERGKPLKLRRGDKVQVVSVKGDKAQVTIKGKTAWVPMRLLLVARPKPAATVETAPPNAETPPSEPAAPPSQEPAPAPVVATAPAKK